MPGNDDPPTEPSNGPPVAPDEPAPSSSGLWLVSYDDNDDREMRVPEIAAAIARGDIDAETIVWREGLSGWLPIAEVPALAQLLPSSGDTRGAPPVGAIFIGGNGQRARRSDAPPLPPPRKSKPPPAVEEGKPQTASAVEEVKPPAEASQPEPPADDEPAPESLDPESLSAESIRALAEASQGPGDARTLSAGTFGMSGADEAKAEGASGRRPPPPPLKPPLKKKKEEEEEIEPAPSSGTPSLSSLASIAPDDKNRHLDELMTLNPAALPGARPAPLVDVSTLGTEAVHDSVEPPPSSGAPAAARQAPTKTSHRAAPAQAPAPAPASGPSQLIIASIVGGIIAGGAVFLAVKSQAPPAPAPPPPQTVTAAAPPPPTTPATTPPVAAPLPAPTALPPSAAVPAPPPVPTMAPTTAAPTAKAPTVAAPTAQRPATAAPKPTATAAATAAPTAPPTAAATAPAASAAAPAAEPAAAPFDKAAAGAALTAAAGRASACRKDGDPTGQAIVRVTFSNSGKATQALIEGPPFAGTATGGCIAAAMRSASVPPYSGDRVTVSKTVNIN